MSDPIDDRTSRAAALTSEELLRRTTQEFIDLRDSGAGMWLELHPAAAFAVVAMCQLALRHPDTKTNASAPLVEQFIEYVRAKFEPHAPAIAEAIRRGNEPEHDTPRDRYLETAPNTKGRDWVRERFEAEPEPEDKHQIISRRIMDLRERGEPVNRVTLANELMRNGELQAIGGLTYLVSLYEPPPPAPLTLIEFLASRKEPASPEEILEHLKTQHAPPAVLTCPYCGFSRPAPFEKVDLYICEKCGRTVETE